MTTQYASLSPVGVAFSSTGGLRIADAAAISGETGGVPVSGSKALDAEPGDVELIRAAFVISGTSTPTTIAAAGGWMVDLATFGGGTVRFFDINNVLIDSVTVAPAVEGNQFFGAVNALGIAAVTFDGVDSGEFVIIDDFVFAPVPEPGTACLAGLGILCCLIARRRLAACRAWQQGA